MREGGAGTPLKALHSSPMQNGKASSPTPVGLDSDSQLISNVTLFRGVLLPKHLEIGCVAFFGSVQKFMNV